MSVISRFKLKKVAFQNNLLAGHPTQYKLAMVTPIVVSHEKFVENVMAHTGMHRSQVVSFFNALEDCAGDYMEMGNAVQMGDDFGTIKPAIKVRAKQSKDDCKADSVASIGIRFIPTGRMRERLANVGFVVVGESDGSDVDDSEVTPSNPGGGNTGGGSGSGGGNTGGGSGSGGNGGGSLSV